MLHAVQIFASKSALDDYLYIILPALVRLSELDDSPLSVRIEAVQTIAKIARMHDIADHASRIIHPFARILVSFARGLCAQLTFANYQASGFTPLHVDCLNVICTLIKQLGTRICTLLSANL